MNNPTNDNELVPASELTGPDPHGHAAVLLVESLIHGLVARSILSVSDAVEIVNIAAEVKIDIAEDVGDTPAAIRRSLRILGVISKSLSADIAGR